jgi:histidinol dehydrogenase
MLNRLDLRGCTDLTGRLPRPRLDANEPVRAVRAIIDEVRERGDLALAELTERFDGVRPANLRVPREEIDAALAEIGEDLREALSAARDSIRSFHESQLVPPHRYTRDGIVVDASKVPVDRAGIYVPGGRATYPSTVLMTAVPARVAGVSEVVLCVPPGPDGHIAPITLAAAALTGVDEVYAVGGAQAIAAMAYGTGTIRPVDTISGPGNVYVAIAKREVAGVVGVPSAFTGPSEVVVVADATASADLVAIDLVVQAEHGPNGLSWLVTWDEGALDPITNEVTRLVA